MKQLTQHPNEKSNLTKAEFKRRLAAHRRRKQELAKKMEEEMRIEFKKHTGQEATSFEIW